MASAINIHPQMQASESENTGDSEVNDHDNRSAKRSKGFHSTLLIDGDDIGVDVVDVSNSTAVPAATAGTAAGAYAAAVKQLKGDSDTLGSPTPQPVVSLVPQLVAWGSYLAGGQVHSNETAEVGAASPTLAHNWGSYLARGSGRKQPHRGGGTSSGRGIISVTGAPGGFLGARPNADGAGSADTNDPDKKQSKPRRRFLPPTTVAYLKHWMTSPQVSYACGWLVFHCPALSDVGLTTAAMFPAACAVSIPNRDRETSHHQGHRHRDEAAHQLVHK
jgi:hypothetical protein